MHPVGEKRGHSKYTAEALESIKQDLTRFEVHNNRQNEAYKIERYDKANGRNDATETHNLKPQLENTSAGSASLGVAFSPNRQSINGHIPKMLSALIPPKSNREPNIVRDSVPFLRCSPALDSGAGSSRSNSPLSHQISCLSRSSAGQYSPSSSFNEAVPPVPPPRNVANCNTPPPPPINPALKRRSPALTRTSALTTNQSRSTSIGMPHNSYLVQQQLAHPMKALSVYHVATGNGEPPPPYPINAVGGTATVPPPSYTASIQSRQSPTQSPSDYRKSPSSGIYSATSGGSGSPITIPNSSSSPLMQGICASRTQPRSFQGRTQQPIIMQSVKSTQVQKPVLQTAVAPQTPLASSANISPVSVSAAAAPSYSQKSGTTSNVLHINSSSCTRSSPVINNCKLSDTTITKVPCTEPPSYARSIQAKTMAVHRQNKRQLQPQQQPNPNPNQNPHTHAQNQLIQNMDQKQQNTHIIGPKQQQQQQPQHHQVNLQIQKITTIQEQTTGGGSSNFARQKAPPPPYQGNRNNIENTAPNNKEVSNNKTTSLNNINSGNSSVINKTNHFGDDCFSSNVNTNGNEVCAHDSPGLPSPNNKLSNENQKKIKHASPIPERKKVSKEKEEERKEFRIRQYSSQAFKFFMEQHIENVIKSHKQRTFRKNQLEKEMLKIGLPAQTQVEMRKMLSQKESNYIRLKRAKMDKSMFVKIKPIGVGAFGEVTLVRKIDTTNHLYAMKTLRKADVLKRNQVAHVKAERDILAEADNNWVVKLYYSFQDNDNLYFVMDYIPGGDLMSLLIKKGIFEESLAQFYIAELTCAVESVHKMGFIHRDIKPDNILIDRDGHIKLTDFGLCTGFRWTHNSKYYQENCNHSRQDSMEPWEDFSEIGTKPTVLERRRIRDHQRVLAHSLVGTPNYIAPEVLERSGYTQLCDWWSVGVILYEMLVGQPPFLANTPQETQQKVINWETTLRIPPQAKLSCNSTDLIRRLCSSSDKRLGKSADEVKAHEFFTGIDFADMRKQRAPYIPKIEHPTDTSNFDPIDPDKLRSADSNLSGGDFNDIDRPFHGFFEFTFRRFFDDRLNADTTDEQSPVYV